MNNDGYTDIYWWRFNGGANNEAWVMYGTGWSGNTVYLPYWTDSNWKMISAADFNRDGQLDLLWRHATAGLNAVWLMSGGTYLKTVYLQPLTDTNWEIVATGYFDGTTDRNIDLLWRNKVTGDNAVWLLDGIALISTALIQEVPDLNWKVGGTGDFNNDGFTDIAWRHGTTGVNAVWYMQGTSFITAGYPPAVSDLNWQLIGTGQFNGDSKTDMVWRNAAIEESAIWVMDGVNISSADTFSYRDANYYKMGGAGDSKFNCDGDSLPDVWERNYFGNLGYAANDNPDQDSRTNLQEYQDGTDPSIAGQNPTLADGVDYPPLTWITGGDAAWFHKGGVGSMPWLSDIDSAQSGAVGNNQSTYMETTVTGPGTFTYYYKVSSEANHDYFKVYKNGTEILSRSGEVDWTYTSIALDSGSNVIRFQFSMDGAWGGGYNAAWVDFVRVDRENGSSVSLAEGADYSGGTWQTDDEDPPWYGIGGESSPGGGGDSIRSGAIDPDRDTYVQLTVSGAGYLSFYWKVDSEPGYDFLSFNGEQISGFQDWTYKSYYLSSGGMLSWVYDKDENIDVGADRGWVDCIRFDPDSDADGLADSWETQYFGSTSSQNGNGDFDADGFTNLQEYLNGTNPAQAELRVKIATPRNFSVLP
ncbi:MAG: VCBS repeat-containing protein [Verrucomicrobia bacterium]|nr:VCBS repeat-containing protein [Verrucomicrobiota bacterium]